MKKRICVSLILVAVFSGCSDEADLTKFVQAYLDKEYPRCYLTENFPMTIQYGQGHDIKQLLAMVKIGLLSKKELQKLSQYAPPIYEYDLTEEGRKHYTPDAEKKGYDDKMIGGFCFGKAKVTSIEFTEKSEDSATSNKKVKSANITYLYSVSEFPEWAKNEEVKSSNPILKYDMDSEKTPVKGVMNLVLTNKGWEIWNAFQLTPSSGIGW